MNVSTYIASLTEVVQRLRSLGETVSRETMIAKIVRGLPEQFNNFRKVWRIAPNPNLTIAELQGKLMNIENESGKEQTVKSNLGDTLMSKEKQWRTKSPGKQQGKLQGKQQGQSKSNKVLRCHNCDSIGHFARDYPSEKSVKDMKRGNDKESSAGHDVKEAFMSSLSDDDNEWMADSAAYRHIIKRKEWFSELKPLNPPEKVRIGDDKYLNATAKGTIHMYMGI